MSITNVFSNVNYELSSKINSDVSQLTINFTVPNYTPNGYLKIDIPSEVGILSTLVCTLNSRIVQCNKSQNSIVLLFTNETLVNTLVIQNVTNPKTAAPTTTAMTLTLNDNTNLSSLYSSIGPITNTYPSKLAFIVSTNVGFFA